VNCINCGAEPGNCDCTHIDYKEQEEEAEELPTAAYEFEKYDVNEGEYGWATNKLHPEKGTVEFRNVKELVRRRNVEDFFEIQNLINQLAIAHRHVEQHDIDGEARKTNERLQRKLEEVQNQK